MKNWWKLCVVAAISWVWAPSASAREVTLKVNIPSEWSTENPTPVGFSIDGVTGVWIRTETARRYLKLEVELKAAQDELTLTQEKVSQADSRIILLEERVTLTEQERDTWKVKWTNENAMRVSLESDRHVWWRKPWVWFTVGVVVGGVTTAEIVRVTR